MADVQILGTLDPGKESDAFDTEHTAFMTGSRPSFPVHLFLNKPPSSLEELGNQAKKVASSRNTADPRGGEERTAHISTTK
jgi:hypothetical protein